LSQVHLQYILLILHGHHVMSSSELVKITKEATEVI
jgi:hypothetical protein